MMGSRWIQIKQIEPQVHNNFNQALPTIYFDICHMIYIMKIKFVRLLKSKILVIDKDFRKCPIHNLPRSLKITNLHSASKEWASLFYPSHFIKRSWCRGNKISGHRFLTVQNSNLYSDFLSEIKIFPFLKEFCEFWKLNS